MDTVGNDEDPGPGDHGNRRWTRRRVLGLGAAGVGAAVGSILFHDRFGGASSSSTEAATGAGAPGGAARGPGPGPATTTATPRTSIADENARPGTTDWQIAQDPAVWEKIRGYLSRTSVAQGEPVDLFVSTKAATFTAAAYRMGFYQGTGGRLVWSSQTLRSRPQPPPQVDPRTNLREARWEPTLRLTPDDSWPPGCYLFKLVSADGGQSQIPLVIRDDGYAAPVHIQNDVTTWQAYNRWGGASLYGGENGRSKVVSFDRPYDDSGSGHFLGGVYEVVQLVESLGLEVTYSTSLDTHVRPEVIANAKVWITGAHDEYWSKAMRANVEAARDRGVNLMFLGANNCYRRIRLEDSPLGPNRRVVNYRVAKDDPRLGFDNDEVTTSWREAPNPKPESSLTGSYYESNPCDGDMVIVAADEWMFEGTGVRNGDRWAHLVGNEYDRVTPEAPTPKNIQVLAHSPLVVKGRPTFSDMTYYTTDSGAGVFTAGSIWFERHLRPDARGTDAQIVGMMKNLLRVFSAGPAGRTHPARRNLDALGIKPGYLKSAPG